MADSVRKLAQEIEGLRREVRAQSVSPRLAHTSIEDGGFNEYSDGTLVSRYGTQHDATHTTVSFSGPVPPQPSTPQVTPGLDSLTVRWNGKFFEDALSPMDFSHIEVHVSTDPGYAADTPATLRATLRGELGDETVITPLEPGTYYVRFVARSLSSKPSTPSFVATGSPTQIEVETDDGIAPPVPSTPVVVADGRILSVSWDGLGSAGETMPGDFALGRVASAPSAAGPWKDIDSLPGLGTVHLTDQEYDTPVYFRLTTEDKWGNVSAPSAVASGTPKRLVQTDVILDTIDAAQIEIINAGDIAFADGQVLQAKLTANDLAMESVEGDISTLKVTTIPALQGEIDAAEIRLGSAEGEITSAKSRLTAAEGDITDLTTVTLPALDGRLDTAETNVATLRDTTLPALQGELDAAEIRIGSAEGEITSAKSRITATEGDISTLETTTIPALDGRLDTAESDVSTLKVTTIPALQGEIDAAEVRLTNNEGEITNAKSRLTATEGDISTLEVTTIPALQGRLTATEGDINTLETVTIPGLNSEITNAKSRLTANEGEITSAKSRLTATEGDISTLETTTIPALSGRLTTAESEIGTLSDTTIPALRSDLNTADNRLDTAENTLNVTFPSRFETVEGELDAVPAQIDTKITNATPGILATAADAAQQKADAAEAAAVEATRTAEDKVVNGSFELGFVGWEATSSNHGIDETVSRTGSKSYFTTGSGNLYQTPFPVKEGETWRFEWWYKTEPTYSSSSPGGLRLQASTTGIDGTFGDAGSTGFHAQENWTYQRIDYEVPAGVTHIRCRIAFAYSGGAKAWMDDVRLYDVTEIKRLEAAAKTAEEEAVRLAGIAADDKIETATPGILTTAGQNADTKIAAMAGTKNSVTRSVNNPPTTNEGGVAGDFWRKIDAANVVIGEWQWDGAAWKEQKLSGARVSNMDIGYLTAGAAVMSQALIDKLVAGTAAFQTVDAGNITVTGTSNLSDVVADRLAAQVGRFVELTAEQIVSGEIATNLLNAVEIAGATAAFQKVAVENITATETATLNSVVAQKVAAATATFQTVDAGNITVTGTSNLSNAVADRLSAQIAAFIELSADRITSGEVNTELLNAVEIAAATATFQKVDVGNITATDTATLNNVVAQKVAAATATFQKVDAANITVTGTSNLSDVVADRLAVQVGKFVELTAEQIVSGEIATSLLNATEIAGATAAFQKVAVENITATETATLNSVVAQRVAAATATFQTVDAGNITVTGTSNLSNAVADRLSAQIATFIELSADRITSGEVNTDLLNTTEIAAQTATIQKVTVENITATSTATINSVVAQRIAAGTASFQKVDAGNITVTGVSNLTDVVASRISAQVGKFVEINVSQLNATSANMDQAVIDQLWTDVVMSRKITTENLVVSDFTDLVDNGRFDNGLLGWQVNGSPTIDTVDMHTAPYPSVQFNSTDNLVQERAIKVQPGDKLHVSVWYKTTLDKSGPGGLRMQDAASGGEATTWESSYEVGVSETWTLLEAVAVVKPNVYELRPRLAFALTSGIVWLSEHSVRRMTGSVLIEPGAITTPHLTVTEDMTVKLLAAHKVEAGEIDTNSLAADVAFVADMKAKVLTADSIQTIHLDVTEAMTVALLAAHKVEAAEIDTANLAASSAFINSLSANTAFVNSMEANIVTSTVFQGKTFQGGTFTGGTFETIAGANAGIKIDGALNAFMAFDSTGMNTFLLDGQTGDFSAVGEYATKNVNANGITARGILGTSEMVDPMDGGTYYIPALRFEYEDISLASYPMVRSDYKTNIAIISGARAERPDYQSRLDFDYYMLNGYINNDNAAGGVTGSLNLYAETDPVDDRPRWVAGTLMGSVYDYADSTKNIDAGLQYQADILNKESHTSTYARFGVGENFNEGVLEFFGDGTGTLATADSLHIIPSGGLYNGWSKLNGRLDYTGNHLVTGTSLHGVTVPGVYHQDANAEALTSLGYPEASAGLLEVFKSNTSSMIYQRYTCYKDKQRVFIRGAYNGTWGPWEEAAVTTAWSGITLAGPMDASDNPRARRMGGMIQLHGAARPDTGNFPSGYTTIGWLPAHLRPSEWVYQPIVAQNPTTTGKMVMKPDGIIQVDMSNNLSSYVTLSHVIFPVD